MVYFTSKKLYKLLFINALIKNYPFLFFFLFFSFLVLFYPSSSAFCQVQGTTMNDSISEKSSNSLDSNSLPQKTTPKFSIGLRGGFNIGNFKIANPKIIDKNTSSLGSVLSILANYRINSKFSIQPEFVFSSYKSNNTLYEVAFSQGIIDYSISSFDLNLIGVYSYPITEKLSVSAEAGISTAYLYSSFGKVINFDNLILGQNYNVNSDDQFEKLNYGAIVGITPSFQFKKINFQASIRYRYGFNNINTFDYRLNRYLTDSQRTIQTRNILFQVGVLVPIAKKVKKQENGD
jgi:hypothetical protein